MYCPKCAAPVKDNAMFCPKCGTDLKTVEMWEPRTAALPVMDPAPIDEPGAEFAGMSAKEQKKAHKRELKESKAAYKQARKNAGKSNAPKVVGALVAVAVVAAVAVGGTLFATGVLDKGTTNTANQTVAAAASESATNNANTNVATTEKGAYAAYIGTWTGKLDSTRQHGLGASAVCYGAASRDMELTISSISSNGMVKGSLVATYHGHFSKDLSGDVESHTGDSTITIKDFTATFNEKSLSFVGEIDGTKNCVKGTIDFEKAGDTLKMKVSVTSVMEGDNTFTDTFVMTKKA